jgi:hypothetical protein|tara:strand:- start:4704 stop:5003 length:300 start_codon:yes stop_codon:yes gene_type:complete
MKLKFKPTITIEVPDRFEKYVDEAKCNRYCGYNTEHGYNFEAQLTEMALTRFLSYATASAISDKMQEADGIFFPEHEGWANVVKDLAQIPVTVEWSDDA